MPSRCLPGSRRRTQPTRPIYNPQGFDPTAVLPFHLHRYADYARFFLHILYAQRVFKDLKEEFVPLKAAYLRRFFPSNAVYKQVREALLASETIVCDGVCYQADTLTWRNLNDRHRAASATATSSVPDGKASVTSDDLTTKALLKSIAKINLAQTDRDHHPATPAHLALSPGHHDRSRLCGTGTRRLDGRCQFRRDRWLHRSAHDL